MPPISQNSSVESAGMMWKKVKVTATGAVADIGPGTVFGGIMMPVAGTSTTLTMYDAGSAVAANLLFPTTATLTAGQFVSPFGGVGAITVNNQAQAGMILTTGLYLTVGGTGSPSFWVLYR